jgi:hypothetical protein
MDDMLPKAKMDNLYRSPFRISSSNIGVSQGMNDDIVLLHGKSQRQRHMESCSCREHEYPARWASAFPFLSFMETIMQR